MRKKRLQKIVALFMVVAMILNLTPSGLAISAADDEPATVAANGTDNTESDTVTNTDWQNQMSEDSDPSSASVGRIWTDKSVTDADYQELSYGNIEGEKIYKTDGADFLVELSALSSTSSLTETVESSQPLDIVLVLDVSGSMSQNITSYTYTEVYSLSTGNNSPTYYVSVNGTYYTLRYGNNNGWYYSTGNGMQNRVYVTPMTSADDADETHVQAYTRSSTTTTKLKALQAAVDNFANLVAAENNKITDTTKQHRISLVKFASDEETTTGNDKDGNGYNCSQTVLEWATYTSDTVSKLTTDTVDKLTAAGATRADYGLNRASALLKSARDYAQQVVIFFTDGEPTSYQNFEDSVAGSAVTKAKSIKDGGALIYSVAIYSGADPSADPTSSNTSNINKFLHAVSSNYPNATDYTPSTSLGTRAANSNYYLAATDAEELKNIFVNILTEVTPGTVSSPTKIEDTEDPTTGGYVTFTDELGSYMEVKDFNAIVVEQTIYGGSNLTAGTAVTNADGSVTTPYTNSSGDTVKTVTVAEDTTAGTVTTTYVFSGEVTGNIVHTNMGKLDDLVIQVVSYPNNIKQGDIVTVKIPASLLPLLYYDIDTDENNATTMDITYDYPLRVFYSVGLKDDVEDAVTSGDYDSIDGLAAYVAANTGTDGNVYFYSNYYDGTNKDSNDNTYGNTTVTFTPAVTNSFYYFQEDTAVYTDEDCTIQATSIEAGKTYYYKYSYFVATSALLTDPTTGEEYYTADVSEAVNSFTLTTVNSDYFTTKTVTDAGGTVQTYSYIAASAPRISLGEGDAFKLAKTGNNTDTADYALYPTWTGGSNAVTYLGNNGSIWFGSTGSLAVSKTITAASNLNPDMDAEFSFTVTLKDASGNALTGTYTYSLVDAATGEAITDATSGEAITGTIASGGTLTMKSGQKVVIIGIPVNSTYTVTENNGNSLPGGYSLADTTVYDGTNTTTAYTTSGTIASATTAVADFTNTYKVGEITVDTSVDTDASAAKVLTGRAWESSDEFVFYLMTADGTTVLPDADSIKAKDSSDTVTATAYTYTSGNTSVDAIRISVKATAGTAADTEVGFTLGTYTFTEPGTYTYRLLEYDANNSANGGIAGITYSDATYTLTFVVTDNTDGTMSYTYTLTRDTDDSGNTDGNEDTDGVAAFTNTYDATKQSIEPTVYKSLNGVNAPAGSFTFEFEALNGAPTPDGVTDTTWTVPSGDAGIVLAGQIYVEAADDGKTYEYLVSEVDAGASGVVYDDSVYKFSYEIHYGVKPGSTSSEKVVYADLTIYKLNSSSGEYEKVDTTGSGSTEIRFYNTSTVTIGETTENGIKVTKKLTGRPWQAGDSFTFTLTAGTNTAAGSIDTPMPTGNGNTKTVNSSTTDYTAYFGDITYNAAGVYNYTIKETQENIAGITYDDSVISVTVTVTQNADGSFSTAVSYSNGTDATSAVFTNTYKAESYTTTSTTFGAKKVIDGRSWLSTDMFEFVMTAENDAPLPSRTTIEARATNQTPYFEDTVTYTEAGTYVYYITETSGTINGITYSNQVYKVVVEVTDNYANGKLEATVTYYEGTIGEKADYSDVKWTEADNSIATFTNSYKATPVTTRYVGGSKSLVGYTMTDDDVFTFTLTATEDTMTAINSGIVTVTPDDTSSDLLGKNNVVSVATVTGMKSDTTTGFTFGSIKFTQAGNYIFEVNEVAGSNTDITYDSHTIYVTVQVTDDGSGQLSANVIYTNAAGTQNNDWTFTNIGHNNTKTVTTTDDSGAEVDGDNTMVEVGDVLTYTIDWINDYYDADGKASAAMVTVTDTIPTGTELADVLTGVEGTTPSDTNPIVYSTTEANGVTTITWKIQATAAETGSVSFTVNVTEDASSDSPITNTAKVTVGENNSKQYTTNETSNYIPVTVRDMFKVKKSIVDSNGITISTTEEPWTNVDGTDYWFRFVLEAYSVPNGVDAASVLPALQTVTGTTSEKTETAEGNPGIAVNVTSDDVYDFGSVTYTVPGVYQYDLWERSAVTAQQTQEGLDKTGNPLPGISYSPVRYRITVTVTENTDADGNTYLSASYAITYVKLDTGLEPATEDAAKYTSTDGVMVIKNTYDEDEADVRFLGVKVYEDTSGATSITRGAYSFKFTALDGAPTPVEQGVEVNNGSWIVSNDGDGDFSSYPIKFELAKGQEAEYYYYTVKEVVPDSPNAKTTYDTSTYYIQAKVYHNASDVLIVEYAYGYWVDKTTGELTDYDAVDGSGEKTGEFSTTYVDGEGNTVSVADYLSSTGRIEFTNIYDPDDDEIDTGEPETNNGFGLTKTISGRNWTDSDSFKFTLTAGTNTASGNIATPMPDGSVTSNGITTKTVDVTGSGSAASAINFGTIKYSKVGTYTYYVQETSTDGNGITVDSAVRTITVTVTYDATNDALVATVTSVDGDKTFTNTYTSSGTYTGLSLKKTLTGRGMTTGEFDFVITAADDASATKLQNAGLAASGETSYTVTNAAQPSNKEDVMYILTNLTFTQADAGKTYTYTVKEQTPSGATAANGYTLDGVTYDQSEYKIVIKVTDNNDGSITPSGTITRLKKADGTDDETDVTKTTGVSFTNTYGAKGTLDGKTNLTGSKTMVGRSMTSDDSFSFTLKAYGTATESAVADGTIVIGGTAQKYSETTSLTVSSPASTASFYFGDITFTEAAAGNTYTFVVSEVQPTTDEDANAPGIQKDGVTYDGSAYTITVKVTDNGNGTLKAEVVSITNSKNETVNAVSFTNTYYDPEDAKSVSDKDGNDINGELVGLDEVLTYTIDWVNTSVDAVYNTPADAIITIMDTIPTGTDYVSGTATVEVTGGTATVTSVSYNSTTGEITWVISAGAAAYGNVSFDVIVTEEAFSEVTNPGTEITNDAEVKIGDNSYETNQTTNDVPVKTGSAVDENGDPIQSGEPLTVGSIITYTVEFKNTAKNADDVITIEDTLVTGLDYVEGKATIKVGNATATALADPKVDEDANTGAQTLTWTLTGANVGTASDIIVVTFEVEVTDKVGATVANQAIVDGHDSNVDITPVPGDDEKHALEREDNGTFVVIDGEAVSAGQTLYYEISWTNEVLDANGDPVLDAGGDPQYADTVTVTDYLPDGVTVVTTDGGTYDKTNGTITWTFANLSTTDMVRGTIIFTVTVDGTEWNGTITNKAVTETGNYSKTSTVTNTVPEKTVYEASEPTINADGEVVNVGDVLTYVVSYTNDATDADGNPKESNVWITDAAPAGTEYVAGSATYTVKAADGTDLTATYEANPDTQFKVTNGAIDSYFDALPAGATVTVTFKVTVTKAALALDGNVVENQAYVTIDERSVVTKEIVNYVVDKEVYFADAPKTDIDGQTVGVGSELTYTIDWTNSAVGEDEDDSTTYGKPVAATVTVTDEIPAGTVLVAGSVTSDVAAKSVIYYTKNGGTAESVTEANADTIKSIEWTFDAAAGESGQVSFNVKVTEDAKTTGEVTNEATIQVGDTDPAVKTTPTSNDIPVKTVENITAGTDDDGYTVEVGQKLSYTISFTNTAKDENGNSVTADIVVKDTIPTGTTYVADSASWTLETATGSAITAAPVITVENGVITWTFKDVLADAAGTVTFEVEVTKDAQTTNLVTNQATVKIGENGHEVNTNTETSYVPADPEKTLDDTSKGYTATPTTKYDDATGTWTYTYGDVAVSNILEYVISYYNYLPYATTITIEDTLDANVELTSATGTPADEAAGNETITYVYDDTTRTITWTIKDVAALTGGSVELHVEVMGTVRTDDNNIVDSVSNQATVKVGEVTNKTNIVVNTIDPNNYYDDPEKNVVSGSKGENNDAVKVGDQVTYGISYYNHNDVTADIIITDELDPGVKFISASGDDLSTLAAGETSNYYYEYNETLHTVTWTIKDAAAYTTGRVTLTVEVTEDAQKIETTEEESSGASISNTAYVTIGNESEVKTNTYTNEVYDDPEDPVKTETEVNGAATSDPKETDATEEADATKTYGVVDVGDVLTYEISYYNYLNTPATVTITDVIDEGLYLRTATITGTEASNAGADEPITWTYDTNTRTLTWTIKADQFTGGTVSFEVRVTSDAKETESDETVATVENQATVEIKEDDYTNKTNVVINPLKDETTNEPTKSAVVTPKPEATNAEDEPTAAAAEEVTAAVGDTITYTINYRNYTNTTADVVITDKLDAGVDFVTADGTNKADLAEGEEAAVVYEYNSTDHIVTWTIKNVAPFTSGSVTLTVIVNENAKTITDGEDVADIDNTAQVKVGNEKEVNTNEVEIPVTPDDPGDGPTKTIATAGVSNGDDVSVNQELTYEISYYNYTNEVVEVTITDTLEAGLDFVAASDGYSLSGKTVTWKLTAQPFKTVSVTLTVKVNENAKTIEADETKATVENQASVQVNNDPAIDTNVVENPITPDDPEDGPKKTITTEGVKDGDNVSVGDELTYEISYYNNTNEKVEVTITDTLEAGLDFVSATEGYSVSGKTYTWKLTAEPFKTVSVTLTVKVNENAKTIEADETKATVENQAFVQVNNEAEIGTNVVENPITPDEPENPTKTISSGSEAGYYDENGNVAVETDKDGNVTGSTVGVGGIIEYVIGYYNYENTTATITITDELDPGVMFVSAEGVEVTDLTTVDTETAGDSYVTYRVETTTDVAGNEVTTVIWTIFNVKPFTKGSVLLQVEVLEAAKTPAEGEDTATVENEATAENSEDPDNTYTSNVVVNEISPDDPGDPAKTVTADSEAGVDGAAVDVGEEITYAITYYNHNQTKADVTITDALDIGVEFVEAGEGGVYDAETHTVTWNISDVTAFTGGFVTVTVRVTEAALKLDPGDTMGDVENQAEVQVGDITNSTNIVVNPIAPGEPEEPTKIVDDSELKEIDEDGNYVYESAGIYDTITYEIEYYNHHNEIAIIEIIDKLDEGVDFITASGVKAENATDSDLVTWVYDEETHTVTWTIVELPWTGGTVSVTVQVNENAKLVETGEVIATVENEATVIVAPDMEHETTMNSNKVIVPIDPDQPADPSKVVVSDEGSEGSSVAVGDEVIYMITWYNYNNVAADVTITDVLDEGVDFVSATGTEKSKATDADTVVYEVTTDADGKVTVTWTITGVAPFTAGSVELTVKVNENAKKIADDETQATVSNTASVQIGNDPAVNTNTTENPIDPDDPKDPTKTITTEGVKEGDTVEAGDVLTYEIGFYNHTNEVATVTITDTLDAGVDYVSSTEGGVYDKTTHTVTWILTVAPFTEGSVSVTIKVNETAEAQISNTAYVKIDNGTDSDATTDPTDPDEPDNGTPTNTVTNPVKEEVPAPAPTEPVPTTSDTEAVVPYTVMMLMAFAAIIILLKGRRRENA